MAQPSLKCLVLGPKGKVMGACVPLPDTGSVVTLVSKAFCEALEIPVRPDPMAMTLYGVNGMTF